MNKLDPFTEQLDPPYSVRYQLPDVGFVEVFKSGRIVGATIGYAEWHEFHTLQEAKDWLIAQAIAKRMTK